MDKPAPVDHDVHDLIRARWSPRALDPRPIDAAALGSLLEAARWAASCFNAQPWRFLLARRDDPAEFERMLACLMVKNQSWAKNAGALLISVAQLNFEHNGQPNRHAFHDVGQAAAQLALQATALGLAVHQMGGFDRDLTRSTYAIPEGYEPVAAIAVGYPGPLESLPEPLQGPEAAPRARKGMDEIVYAGTWGQVRT